MSDPLYWLGFTTGIGIAFVLICVILGIHGRMGGK